MKKLMLVLVASAGCLAFTMNASAQQADQATADAVIAMTKAQWAAEIKDPTSVAEQSKDTSDDYTEFNGDYATPRWQSDEFTAGGGYRKSLWQDDRGGNGQSQSPGIQRGCCDSDLQLCRSNTGQGRKNDTESRKIDSRLCEKGRQMDVGPRKLCVGSTAKTIRL